MYSHEIHPQAPHRPAKIRKPSCKHPPTRAVGYDVAVTYPRHLHETSHPADADSSNDEDALVNFFQTERDSHFERARDFVAAKDANTLPVAIPEIRWEGENILVDFGAESSNILRCFRILIYLQCPP